MASLYESESITRASGTRRGSADSTPSTSRPDMDLGSLQQRPEDRGREVAAVASEGGAHAAPVGGDEAGDHERAVEVRWYLRLQIGARLGPLDARPQPPQSTSTTRLASTHCTGPAALALLEKALKQARRPDLAIAGDEVTDRAGGRTCQLHRVQDAQQILASRSKPVR